MERARRELDVPLNRWQLRFRQNPNIIWENGIAYDPRTRRVVFHGGHVGRLYPQSTYTFLYDLGQNRFFEAQAPNRPQRLCLISFDYLDSCQRFITCNGLAAHGSLHAGEVFGGDYRAVTHAPQVGPWLYDSAADHWEDCRPLPLRWPARRIFAPVTYEYASDVLATLGARELVLFCPRTNRVVLRALPEELHGRRCYGLAADPARRKLVLFGGHGAGEVQDKKLPPEQIYDRWTFRDTWVYDLVADQWHRSQPEITPPAGMPGFALMNLQMVYHNSSGRVLLLQNGCDRYEGDPAKWPPSQLWSFDAGREQWTRLEVEDALPFAGLLEYAPEEDLLFVFGGGRDGVMDDGKSLSPAFSRQIWTCRLAVAEQAMPPVVPQRLAVRTTEESVTVTWPESGPHQVLRAEVDSSGIPGHYKPVASGARGEFTDSGAVAGKVCAYQVIGPNGASSLPGFNQPFRPGRLRASVDRPAQVTLRWQAGDEPDVAGYHVYRADGPELEQGTGRRLTTELAAQPPFDLAQGGSEQRPNGPRFVDRAVNLADGLIRSYWVTAVNRLGVESGASPLAYTVPDAPESFTFMEGLAPSNGLGVKQRWLISWAWPEEQAVAGFNVYHADRHVNTRSYPGGYEAFEKLWTRVNAEPIRATEMVYDIPQDSPADHYFYVRAVNTLGQEGFRTDILSPTDRQFRP